MLPFESFTSHLLSNFPIYKNKAFRSLPLNKTMYSFKCWIYISVSVCFLTVLCLYDNKTMGLVSKLRRYMVNIHETSLSYCPERYNVSIKLSELDIYAAVGRRFHTGMDCCQLFGTEQVTFSATFLLSVSHKNLYFV